MTEFEASRRNVLAGVAMAGVAVPLLAACGDDGGSGSTIPGSSAGAPASGTASPGTTAGAAAIKTAEIPVGGGKIFTAEKIVVTQPKAGEFKAFSAVCTHQGCLVSKVASGSIDCACHGSKFSIDDGSVEGGPAPQPLPEKTVTVSGATLTVS